MSGNAHVFGSYSAGSPFPPPLRHGYNAGMNDAQLAAFKKVVTINVIVVTAVFATVALFAHFTIVADPNSGWPLGEQINKSVGIWWVVLATAVAAFQQSFIAWSVFLAKRKRHGCELLK